MDGEGAVQTPVQRIMMALLTGTWRSPSSKSDATLIKYEDTTVLVTNKYIHIHIDESTHKPNGIPVSDAGAKQNTTTTTGESNATMNNSNNKQTGASHAY